MPELIIDLTNITKLFNPGENEVRALEGIDLKIFSNEFVSLIGASGSGKSTLLNILGCLDQPTAGSYLLKGEDVSFMSKSEISKIRNRNFGFVFQAYNLLPKTSAIENVELPLLYNPSFSIKERRDKAKAVLKRVGLENRIYHKTNELSGGQQQRVAIARALVNDPLVIFADEPTGNLDSKTGYQIMELFQELNQKGILIVMVTHELDIVTFTKRKIVLHDGVIIEDVLNENVMSAHQKLIEIRRYK
jgi:putative ABC transport system ATP-binding protein